MNSFGLCENLFRLAEVHDATEICNERTAVRCKGHENYFPRCPCSLQDVFYHDIIGFVSVPMFENGHFDPLCHDRI